VLQTRQTSIQSDLDAKRAELARIQDQLRQERIRLVRLREKLAAAKDALAERLVEIYKADEPDAVTVILEADGFEDLITRAEFIDRIGDQDGRIIDRVRTAKADSVRAEAELDQLEERQRRVTAEVGCRRWPRSRASSSTAATTTPRCATRSSPCSPTRGRTATTSRAT
jgi:peptidoglycan hydrolase CwlO-like protein